MTGVHLPLRDPVRPAVLGLAWRVPLVLAAMLAVLLDAPAAVRAPLALLALVGTATLLAGRFRRRGVLDLLLLVVGGGIALLVLTGLLLDVLPSGLSRPAWGVAVAVLELGVLVPVALLRPVPAAPPRLPRPRPATIAWAVATVAVLVGAVALSAASYRATHVAPLAFSAEPHGGTTELTVTSGSDAGPYRIVLVAGRVHRVLDGRVEVAPGHAYHVTLPTPPTPVTVQLVPVGGTASVRELILDPSGR